MRVPLSIISAALVATSAYAGAEYSANVYEGPTECEGSERIAAGNFVTMHYTGTIDESSDAGEKGKKFDSSRDRNDPFRFQSGSGQVIKGWEEGLIGLCKGAKATLILPPDYGYGAEGSGSDIPGGATLNFDVEVIDVEWPTDAAPQSNYFAQIDENGDGKIDKDEVISYLKKMAGEDTDVDPSFDPIAESENVFKMEDADEDGFISWDEFSGPKGDAPTGDEL